MTTIDRRIIDALKFATWNDGYGQQGVVTYSFFQGGVLPDWYGNSPAEQESVLENQLHAKTPILLSQVIGLSTDQIAELKGPSSFISSHQVSG